MGLRSSGPLMDRATSRRLVESATMAVPAMLVAFIFVLLSRDRVALAQPAVPAMALGAAAALALLRAPLVLVLIAAAAVAAFARLFL